MYFKSFSLLVFPLLSLAAPIPVPVEERRSLFLDLPLHKRLILFKRGLFSEALKFSDLGTPVGVGVAVANLLKGPQQACKSAHLFRSLEPHPFGRFTRSSHGDFVLSRPVDTVFPQVTMRNKSSLHSGWANRRRERTPSGIVRLRG